MSLRSVVYKTTNYVMGTQAGLSGNLESRRVLREARRGLKWQEANPNPDAKALMNDGFRILPRRFDEASITDLREEFVAKLEDSDHTWSTPDGGYHTAFHKPVVSLPNVTKLLDATVIDAVQSYYKCYVRVNDVVAWRNRHYVPEESGNFETYSERWHIDGSKLNGMSYFVSLGALTESDGPLRVQTKRRTKQLIRMGFKREDYTRLNDQLEAPEHVNVLTGPVGTNYCANVGRVLHRAGIPVEGHVRDIINFALAPSPVPLANNWAEAYR
jgi:hypothetical protein